MALILDGYFILSLKKAQGDFPKNLRRSLQTFGGEETQSSEKWCMHIVFSAMFYPSLNFKLFRCQAILQYRVCTVQNHKFWGAQR